MNILVIDNGSRDLTPLYSKLSSHAITTILFTDFDFTAPNTANIDLIILPGANQYSIKEHMGVFEKECAFIRTISTPLLGICFGAELLAHAYGGILENLPEKVNGVREITIKEPAHPLFAMRAHLQVRENHRFAIKTLHPPLETLATSTTGIEICEHITKSQLGMQFHPESLLHTADGEWLLEKSLQYLVQK